MDCLWPKLSNVSGTSNRYATLDFRRHNNNASPELSRSWLVLQPPVTQSLHWEGLRSLETKGSVNSLQLPPRLSSRATIKIPRSQHNTCKLYIDNIIRSQRLYIVSEVRSRIFWLICCPSPCPTVSIFTTPKHVAFRLRFHFTYLLFPPIYFLFITFRYSRSY